MSPIPDPTLILDPGLSNPGSKLYIDISQTLLIFTTIFLPFPQASHIYNFSLKSTLSPPFFDFSFIPSDITWVR